MISCPLAGAKRSADIGAMGEIGLERGACNRESILGESMGYAGSHFISPFVNPGLASSADHPDRSRGKSDGAVKSVHAQPHAQHIVVFTIDKQLTAQDAFQLKTQRLVDLDVANMGCQRVQINLAQSERTDAVTDP